VSPLTIRRYRAERLLRQEFKAMQGRVLAAVRGRLQASGISLDPLDLDACYAQAWQGLYAAVLDGQEIANPAGWLVLVSFRRALEEHRAQRRLHRDGSHDRDRIRGPDAGLERGVGGVREEDLAAELDQRARLRQLFEGLRGRLSGREREAAVLCYLQGLSRSEAAARMGLSESRMRKLMEGPGCGHPGVAGKVGALLETIRGGGWCEEQGSLMRGLAYGILDPEGERYQLALMHCGECPACRAYVLSLRRLAAALPPVLLPWGPGAGVLALLSGGAHRGIGATASAGAGVQAARGFSGGMSASSAAGGGAAGGGWLLVGAPLAGKLAVGCLLALGVGAGCVALETGPSHVGGAHHRRESARASRPRASRGLAAVTAPDSARAANGARASSTARARARSASTAITPLGRASREFGPEQVAAAGGQGSRSARSATARSASAYPLRAASARSASAPAGGQAPAPASQAPARARTGGVSAAEREFAPG
jgi:RNA polymerase sigma factor (sigma-70 family)